MLELSLHVCASGGLGGRLELRCVRDGITVLFHDCRLLVATGPEKGCWTGISGLDHGRCWIFELPL